MSYYKSVFTECLTDFIPLYKRLNLEDVKDGAHYETLLQYNFPILLEVHPQDITATLLQSDVITYAIYFIYIVI